ncbi:MAG TPA: cation:proton antiporter [Gemmataceae bacterium]|jgi:Kef-type K+ transport system membrane component KefB|nr:cation:proton antiporter [Gemmataceae bacterium]
MHLTVAQFVGLLAVVLATAKFLGWIAGRIGQPAVLGELVAGVVLGASVLGLIDPHGEILHVLAELGVLLLLFEIGLETDLAKLLRVGVSSTLVAAVGVVVPFALGYGATHLMGESNLECMFAGATLTATSVGITARILSDLGRLHDPESQIVLGAAVIDDVVGLVILAVVQGLAAGHEMTAPGVALIVAKAFGFLAVALLVGRFAMPPTMNFLAKVPVLGSQLAVGLIIAFGMAWLADQAGSALIIGSFVAGLLLRETSARHAIEKGAHSLGMFFVPIFFVSVGAAVDVRVFDPTNPANHAALLLGGLLIMAAVIGKFAAGYAPIRFRGNKAVIGVGMIPRGEVGLIFAKLGLDTHVFDEKTFAAVTLMVMVTTFLAPPLLRLLLPPRPKSPDPGSGT